MKESQGELVARVDARTHVDENYLEQLVKLSEESGAANVGGVKIPVGETEEQQLIAQVMSHPLSFGEVSLEIQIMWAMQILCI